MSDLEWISLAWEAASGYDSIATIERVYNQTRTGPYECVWPCCSFEHKDSESMWRHVHTAHGPDYLPPKSFDPGPWL